ARRGMRVHASMPLRREIRDVLKVIGNCRVYQRRRKFTIAWRYSWGASTLGIWPQPASMTSREPVMAPATGWDAARPPIKSTRPVLGGPADEGELAGHDQGGAGDAAQRGAQVNRLIQAALPGLARGQVCLHDPAHPGEPCRHLGLIRFGEVERQDRGHHLLHF